MLTSHLSQDCVVRRNTACHATLHVNLNFAVQPAQDAHNDFC
jgi:hypothetical protein